MINKLLIANRGEIAVRIIRTAKRMGIRTVAIYSEIDRESLHVNMADESWCIGQSALNETYLNIPKIIGIAAETACDAVHPGYGFLAENPEFVHACKNAGLVFVGPDTRSMQIMGNKIEARKFADSVGVPITRGLTGDTDFLMKHIDEVGFPVLVKAAAGGGGKGMRIVRSRDELREALESTSREAANYFADGTVYIEKFVENPRHIEFQVLGDLHGNIVHLFERECTIQRRYQKIIEEAPSPTLSPEVRKQMGEAAVAIGKAIGYSSAGTIEFLVDPGLGFYFLEMNTRIQVEHPVTEMTTGIDIVEQQLRIASGEVLPFTQEDLVQKGHAIECRIYAEDPANNFLPSPGKMSLYHEPSGEHIRVDSGITGKPEISGSFDPMISKLIVWGENRDKARFRMINALQDYIVHGITSNIVYLLAILKHQVFVQNDLSTHYCDLHSAELLNGIEKERGETDLLIPLTAGLVSTLHRESVAVSGSAPPSVWESIGYWRHRMQPHFRVEHQLLPVHLLEYDPHKARIEYGNRLHDIRYRFSDGGKLELDLDEAHHIGWVSHPEPGKIFVNLNGHSFAVERLDILPQQADFPAAETGINSDPGNIVSPMPGKVIKIAVTEGQSVRKGELMLVVEAMKMENSILSPSDGTVDRIGVAVGDLVTGSTQLVHLVV